MSVDPPAQPPLGAADSSTEVPLEGQPAPAAPQAPRARIRIGSQREPAAAVPRAASTAAAAEAPAAAPPGPPPLAVRVAPVPAAEALPAAAESPAAPTANAPPPGELPPAPSAPPRPPNVRERLSRELEAELDEALAGVSLDELYGAAGSEAIGEEIEPQSRRLARVISIGRDEVFFDLGARNQACISLGQFADLPQPGATIEIVISQFDPELGMYRAMLPGAAVEVGDWSQVSEGIVVDARVTGHNKGGLECQVGGLRGFIPASQASLYRLEDLAQLVGQSLRCVVTEANPQKRNLVLSHRAVLEREQAEARHKLMAELAPGQVREGVVRSLRDFGAFVDLGGVDGLIHVSQLSWARVKHPSEVLEPGQTVKVKVLKIDPQTRKISLGLRELSASPWLQAAAKYPVSATVHGTVSRLAEFGAFVALEPGIEGLIHISELSHKRVFRVADVLAEGQQVEVKVLAVDPEKQRISLSLKALEARPAAQAQVDVAENDEAPSAQPARKSVRPLKGGLGRGSAGEQFGLRW